LTDFQAILSILENDIKVARLSNAVLNNKYYKIDSIILFKMPDAVICCGGILSLSDTVFKDKKP